MNSSARKLAQAFWIGVLAVGCSHLASASANEDAAAYRTNPAHTGQITMPEFTLPLEKKRDVDLGAAAGYPLIAGGKVFVVIPTPLTFTGPRHSLLMAFDAETGHAAWGPIALPDDDLGGAEACYENGRVYVITGGQGTRNLDVVSAYSAANGARAWASALNGQFSFTAAPTALNGSIYVVGAGAGGTLYCVRETDGKVQWTENYYNGEADSPAVTATSVFVDYRSVESYQFDAITGALSWRLSTGGSGFGGGTPAFYNNRLFLRNYSAKGLTSTPLPAAMLDSATGTVLKLFPEQGAMAFDSSMIFGVVNHALTATRISDWTTAWTANNANDAVVTAPTVVNGIVYIGTAGGRFLGYDEATAKLVSTVHLGAGASPNENSHVDMAAGDGIMVVPVGTHLVAIGPQDYKLASMTANPQVAIGGLNVSVTVTLTSAARTGGVVVSLTSSDPRITVPASVTIPAGALSASFTAHTASTNASVRVTLTASFDSAAVSAPVDILPDGLTSLTLSPTPVAHGASATATVKLAYPAPAGGVTVNLATSFAPLAQPSVTHIVIPAGQSAGTFTVLTGVVLAPVSVNIGASVANSNSLLAPITLTP